MAVKSVPKFFKIDFKSSFFFPVKVKDVHFLMLKHKLLLHTFAYVDFVVKLQNKYFQNAFVLFSFAWLSCRSMAMNKNMVDSQTQKLSLL